MAHSSTLPLAFVALLAGASVASGCSGCDKRSDSAVDAAPTTSATPASSSATVVEAEAGPGDTIATEEAGRRGVHRGPGAALFQAARTLELTAEQRQKVEAAEQLGAPPSDSAARDAANDVNAEVIAGIRAGQIDTAKLEPKYASVEKLAVTQRDKEIASVSALHAALDGAQRKAVVASVRAKQAKREERGPRKEAGDGGAADARKGPRRSLDRLLRGLDLDAEQQKKVDALAPAAELKGGGPDPAEMKKRIDSLLVAFEKDAFDAKKTDAFDVKKNRAALEEETKLLSQILPILKPEQREKLAARRDRSSPRGPKRAGHGHRPLIESEDDDFAP